MSPRKKKSAQQPQEPAEQPAGPLAEHPAEVAPPGTAPSQSALMRAWMTAATPGATAAGPPAAPEEPPAEAPAEGTPPPLPEPPAEAEAAPMAEAALAEAAAVPAIPGPWPAYWRAALILTLLFAGLAVSSGRLWVVLVSLAVASVALLASYPVHRAAHTMPESKKALFVLAVILFGGLPLVLLLIGTAVVALGRWLVAQRLFRVCLIAVLLAGLAGLALKRDIFTSPLVPPLPFMAGSEKAPDKKASARKPEAKPETKPDTNVVAAATEQPPAPEAPKEEPPQDAVVAEPEAALSAQELLQASPYLLPSPVVLPAEWEAARKRVSIAGIMKTGPDTVAMIGGNIVKRGEVIPVVHRGKTYRFVVRRILPTGVELVPYVERSPANTNRPPATAP